MNFFEKIGLVESVPTQPEEEPNLNFSFDVAPSAEPATVSPDAAANDIIPQIYAANDLTDASTSVYKVNELLATIPPETPEKTSKTIIVNLLGTLGISIQSIQDDSDRRKALLSDTFNATMQDYENKRTALLEEIKDYEAKIQANKEAIQQLVQNGDMLSTAVQDEIAKINSTLAFIGATEVTPDAAQ
ncbi:hypothetical protein [Gemmiger formicilis]|jgi:hypothetical protein|uniref:hypothetical protein n=1 Tax=Gemmiger formicilis TaxID=745368 RepID=UPI0035226E25